jgi:hypothetical protein
LCLFSSVVCLQVDLESLLDFLIATPFTNLLYFQNRR